MAFQHDRRYKRIFSQPYFIQKLLESFVNEEFIKELDFSSLKRLEKSFINDDFQEKESDLIFSINYKREKIYLFLLIEFQSTVDKMMPIRFLRYITEFYESNRRLLNEGRFPAVFPLLLYSGDPKWTTEYEINRLIKQSIPAKYIPNFQYYAVCENEIPKKSLVRIKNAVSAIFYVENSSPEELQLEIDNLFEIIRDEELAVKQEFVEWFDNYLSGLNEIADKKTVTRKIEDFMEAKTMFATKLKEYEEKLLEQGRAEGIAEGIAEGQRKGIEEGLLESARKLKNNGMPNEEISRILEISIEEIKRLT